MKIDLRVLGIIFATLACAVTVVLLSRYVETSGSRRVAQKMTNMTANKTERISDVLELRLNPMRLQLVLPNCDVSAVNDKFFVHVFVNDTYGRPAAQPINMDFDARKESAFSAEKKSNGRCVIEKSFTELDVYKVEVGQFSTPGGICCTALWSRNFTFVSGAQK